MSEYILNLLPVTEAEKAEFEAIAPDAVHVYAGRRTLTSEQIAQATVILGWPRPKDIKGAARLKWFQTMWAGTDEYEGEEMCIRDRGGENYSYLNRTSL